MQRNKNINFSRPVFGNVDEKTRVLVRLDLFKTLVTIVKYHDLKTIACHTSY